MVTEHSSNRFFPAPRFGRAVGVAVGALFVLQAVLGFGGRVLSPSDLGQNLDQVKTAAFTADMVLNGRREPVRWVLPRDNGGELSRKPPLVNWVGAPIAAAWDAATPPGTPWPEWVIKAPAALFGAGTLLLTVVAGWRLLERSPGEAESEATAGGAGKNAPLLGLLAGGIWLAGPEPLKFVWFLRPDIALVACMTAGWLLATVLLERLARGEERGAAGLRVGLWASVGLGLLAKGPPALLVVAYLPLASWALHRRPWLWLRTGIGWGLPLALGIFGVWLLPATAADPAYVRHGLIAAEVGGRIAPSGPGVAERVLGVGSVIGWFFSRLGLGAVLFVAGLLAIGRGLVAQPGRAAHPAAAAAWFALLVLAVMGLVTHSGGGSYLAPAYPAASVVAVVGFLRVSRRGSGRAQGAEAGGHAGPYWRRRAPVVLAAVCVCSTAAVVVREARFSRGARTRAGVRLVMFADEIADRVGAAAVRFEGVGQNPLPTLLGRHPEQAEARVAEWIVRESIEWIDEAALVAEEFERLTGSGPRVQRLELIRVADGGDVPEDEDGDI